MCFDHFLLGKKRMTARGSRITPPSIPPTAPPISPGGGSLDALAESDVARDDEDVDVGVEPCSVGWVAVKSLVELVGISAWELLKVEVEIGRAFDVELLGPLEVEALLIEFEIVNTGDLLAVRRLSSTHKTSLLPEGIGLATLQRKRYC